MTEEEWLRCNHWRPMLDWLGDGISRRKGMLYLCAGLREIWQLLYSQWSREAVEVAEQFADGKASDDDLHSACYDAECPTFGYNFQASYIREHQTYHSRDVQKLIEMGIYRLEDIEHGGRLGDPQVVGKLSDAAEIAYHLTYYEDTVRNRHLIQHIHGLKEWPGAWLVREIFGDPFRLFQMLPEWRTTHVLALANKAYDERVYDLLPVLADAMEEAGCQHFELLIHLRGEGRHVRGCWALDAILGKA